MAFSVVLFPAEDACVTVVPCLWLKGGLCYWPPHSTTSRKSFSHDKFARACSPPEDTWEAVPYKLIKHADTWETACVYRQWCENGSSMEITDDEATKKRRRLANPKYKPVLLKFGESDDEVLPQTPSHLDVPQFAGSLPPQGCPSTSQNPVGCTPGGWSKHSTPWHQRATPQYCVEDSYKGQEGRSWQSFSSAKEEHLEIRQLTEENVKLRAQLALQSASDERLTAENVELRAQLALQSGPSHSLLLRHVDTMGEDLHKLSNKMSTVLAYVQANGSVGELSFPTVQGIQLPLDNLGDLRLFDSQLRQDTDVQDRLVRCLAVKAGRELKYTVWRMLPCIITNALALLITWTGAGKKASFKDLFLRTILQRAIRKNPSTQDATDEALQNQVTRYLKGAADRAGGRRRCGGTGDLP
uniref:DUF4806 domain-containing protein n=1 Tax=Esox lucius TaxID=8010 RepID=A0AAY5KTJ9_ESOLU